MPTTTPFANLITFSRGSNATVVGPNGLVQWAPSNLLTQSESFDSTAWFKGNTTVTANAAVAPDGSTTADQIAFAAVANANIQPNSAVTVTAGQVYTFSIYVRASAPVSNVRLSMQGSDTTISVGTAWSRVSMTVTASGGTLAPTLVTRDSVAATIFIWGAQLELGTAATTYNPTTVKNLLGFSEAFDNAAWTKNAASIVTGAAANPVNGLFNAQKLMEDTSTGEHKITQTVALVSGTTYTFSLYVKAAGRTAIGFYGAGGLAALAGTVNLVTGATINGSASAVDVGNGWWRISGSGTSTFTGSNSITVRLFSASGTYAGNGSDGVYIYGAQISDSASLDPYVPTPGAAPSSTAYYGPRFDYDPVTRAARGILIEEQRTNLCTRSEEFDNAAWTKVTANVAANATTSPDGTVDADSLTATGGNAQHYVNQSFSYTSGTAYTLSVFAKKNTLNGVQLTFGSGAFSTLPYANFDLNSGTSFTSNCTATLTDFGNGWYRCTMTATATSTTSTTGVIGLARDTAEARLAAFSSDGNGIFIYGAQLEAGAFATSYIPTIASTVTRSADSLFLSGQNFAQWYRQDAGAWYAEFNVLDQAGVTHTVSDGTGNNRFIGYPASSVQLEITTGGVLQASLDGGTITPNTNVKVASAYATNDAALSLNGGTAVSDASVTPPAVNQSRIGANVGGGNLLNGHIRNIRYIPVRAADFQLQALTT